MNMPTNNNSAPSPTGGSPYRLTEEQQKVYDWLQSQRLNVDENTLNYWARKYPAQRLVDVVRFAHARRAAGQQIKNIGGWIHKLLRDGVAVVTDDCQDNRRFAQQHATTHQWESLHIYEKYVKDEITGDDLPLTLPPGEFRRALEALHQRVQLYSD